MGISVSIGYTGTSCWGEAATSREEKPFDMCCPLMNDGESTKFNYWKEKCEIRQKDPNIKDCYRGCKAKQKLEARDKYIAANKGKVFGTRLASEKRQEVIDLIKARIYTYAGIAKIAGVSTSTIAAIKKDLRAEGWKG